MDYADVMKDLGVRGNAAVDGNTTLGKEGAETTLTVNSTSTFNKDVTMKENATVAKDLSVGGNASVSGSVTASSYKVGDKTYISESGINANDQKVVNVAPGRIAADSKDAVNGSQLYQTNERVTGVKTRSTSWTAASTKSGLTQQHWPTCILSNLMLIPSGTLQLPSRLQRRNGYGHRRLLPAE